MHLRKLGRTGSRCPTSATAPGASAAAGGWARRTTSRCGRSRRAIELGVTFIDTARGYGTAARSSSAGCVRERAGDGRTSRRRCRRRTASGRRRTASPVEEAFPGDHIRACVERASATAGSTRSTCCSSTSGATSGSASGDWLETIEALKAEGKIRDFGVSINDHQPENALALDPLGRRRDGAGDLQRLRPAARGAAAAARARSTASA